MFQYTANNSPFVAIYICGWLFEYTGSGLAVERMLECRPFKFKEKCMHRIKESVSFLAKDDTDQTYDS